MTNLYFKDTCKHFIAFHIIHVMFDDLMNLAKNCVSFLVNALVIADPETNRNTSRDSQTTQEDLHICDLSACYKRNCNDAVRVTTGPW